MDEYQLLLEEVKKVLPSIYLDERIVLSKTIKKIEAFVSKRLKKAKEIEGYIPISSGFLLENIILLYVNIYRYVSYYEANLKLKSILKSITDMTFRADLGVEYVSVARITNVSDELNELFRIIDKNNNELKDILESSSSISIWFYLERLEMLIKENESLESIFLRTYDECNDVRKNQKIQEKYRLIVRKRTKKVRE